MTAASSKTPILLVHGWAGSAEAWHPIIARLDARTAGPVIAVRLPGSPGAPESEEATIRHAGAMLAKMMRTYDHPALLVGHSMGAQVTLLAHSMAPERVLGEVVIDPAYGAADTTHAGMDEWAARIENEGHSAAIEFFTSAAVNLSSDDRSRLLADFEATPASTIARYLRSEYTDSGAVGFLPATLDTAALRTRPVFAIHSTDLGARQERLLPAPRGSRIETWIGPGHYLHLELPDRFVEALMDWRGLLEHDWADAPPIEAPESV